MCLDEAFLQDLKRDIKAEALRKRCLEGTQEDVLQTMRVWLVDLNGLNTLCLRAYPGSGKSTVAAHFANELVRQNRMCIIFPFNRNSLTDPVDLWCHVAYMLARRYLVCREVIVSKLKESMDLANATAQEVFRELVVQALHRLTNPELAIPPDCLPVVIIDALDECGGLSGPTVQKARCDVMSQIAQWSDLPPELKLIVTSRPEGDIMSLFSKFPYFALDMDNERLTGDVTKYVRSRLEAMTFEPRPPKWPEDDTILQLAHQSGGLFIWAVTALDFIEEFDPINRLRKVQAGGVALKGVNALYHQILGASFLDDDAVKEFTKLMSAVIVMQRFLGPSDYASLLDMDTYTVHSICGKLRSVLDFGTVLQVKHASFVDFLVTREAQSDVRFRVNPDDGHRLLAESAFRVMNKGLHFNICDMFSSFISNDSLGLAHFQQTIGPILAYACQFWGYHIEHTRIRVDGTMIVSFMRRHFPSWLEAMSGLGQSYSAFLSLKALSNWVGEMETGGTPVSERAC